MSELGSYWVPTSYSFVPHPSKIPDTLLNVPWWKQQAGNIHISKNEINKSSKYINLLVDLFILKYLLFSLFGPTEKEKKIIYIYIYIYIYIPTCVSHDCKYHIFIKLVSSDATYHMCALYLMVYEKFYSLSILFMIKV